MGLKSRNHLLYSESSKLRIIFAVAKVTVTWKIIHDEIIDLFYSLKSPYTKNAVFLKNGANIKVIRKLKYVSGKYLCQPSGTVGKPDTILNRLVKTSAYAPTFGSSGKTIVFGELSYY